MNLPLSKGDFELLAKLLCERGEWHGVRGRLDFLNEAFAGCTHKADILSRLDLDGTPRQTAVHVIEVLSNVLQFEGDGRPLSDLVRKLLGYVGTGKDTELLRDLLIRVATGQPAQDPLSVAAFANVTQRTGDDRRQRDVGGRMVMPAMETLQKNIADLASRARVALDPYILPRVSRDIVRERFLPFLLEAVQQPRPGLLTIFGPAGCGKSTLLGDLSDQIGERRAIPWVALSRTNDLAAEAALDPDALSAALSRELFGIEGMLREVTEHLTRSLGPGVVMIDTLDLILEARTVGSVRRVFQELHDAGATVVTTCRDHELSTYLEPFRERLPGLAARMSKQQVPPFSIGEVTEAAFAFAKRDPQITSEQGRAFVQSVLDLSADSRPLREIIQNPLLLAMLCEVFGMDGRVPTDITVGLLYGQFWARTVATSRKFGSESQVATKKGEICQKLAIVLFSSSQDGYTESVYEADIAFPSSDPLYPVAFAELRSDGVLKIGAHSRLRFFHQTFGEYAIARWLATRSGSRERELLLKRLASAPATTLSLHWWPVVRQLLTIVGEQEFYRLAAQLPKTDLAAFRARAYAAASRDEPGPLRSVTSEVLGATEIFQDTLRQALNGSTAATGAEASSALIELIRAGHWGVVPKACEDAGARITTDRNDAGHALRGAIAAIVERRTGPGGRPSNSETRAQLYGWLVVGLERNPGPPDPMVLSVLRESYGEFNDNIRAAVIRMHMVPQAPTRAAVDLIRIALAGPLGKTRDAESRLRDAMKHLLTDNLAQLLDSGESQLGKTCVDAVDVELPSGWAPIQAFGIAHLLGARTAEIASVVEKVLINCPGERHVSLLRLLTTSAQASEVVTAVSMVDPQKVDKRWLSIVPWLATELAQRVSLDKSAIIECWARGLGVSLSVRVPRRQVEFSTQDVRALANEFVRSNQVAKRIAEFASSAEPPLIAALTKEIEALGDAPSPTALRALVELYRIQARDDTSAATKLRDIATLNVRTAALAAARAITDVARTSDAWELSDLVALARSDFAGVRHSGLDAMRACVFRTVPSGSREIEIILATYGEERSHLVIHTLIELVTDWIKAAGAPSSPAAIMIEQLVSRVLEAPTVEPGAVKLVIRLVKALAHIPDDRCIGMARDWIIRLMSVVDLRSVRNGESEAAAALSLVWRREPTFLSGLADSVSSWPVTNSRAAVLAIRRTEGTRSSMLDVILDDPRTRDEVKALVLEMRSA